jgi:hypothetical protein
MRKFESYPSASGASVVGRQDRRPSLLSLLVRVVSLAALALSTVLAGTALAGEVHVPSATIGEPGSGNGQLSLAAHSGVVANMTTGNIYVSDTGNHRIEEFEPDGTFVRTFAPSGDPGFTPTYLAIEPAGAGNLYVVDASDESVLKFDSNGTQVTSWGSGSRIGGFEAIEGIAVVQSGDLFVHGPVGPGESPSAVRRFDSSGKQIAGPTGEFHIPNDSALAGIAADPDGNLVEHVFVGAQVHVYSDLGEELTEPAGVSQPAAIAVDPLSGDLYLYGEGSVTRRGFNCGNRCQPAESFALGELSDPQGIGIGPGHLAYIADAGTSSIPVYGVENVEPPLATIETPAPIIATGAHVEGHINPNAPTGNPSTYDVQWEFECFIVEGSKRLRVGCESESGKILADSSEHPVESDIKKLTPGVEYEVRLIASNRGGTTEPGVRFTTAAAPPDVGGVFATAITETSAALTAFELNPHGAETTFFFEYLPLSVFEAEGFASSQTLRTPVGTVPVGTAGVEVSEPVGGLTLGTSYAYRLVATNSAGNLTPAPEGTFRTQAPSPIPAGGCPNDPFRVGLGALLPDCRAYELASPADKAGLNVEGFPDLAFAAKDGSAVAFYSQGGTGIPAGAPARQEFTSLLASRKGESWSTQYLLPSEAQGEKAVLLGTSVNARYALVAAGTRTEGGLYLIDTADGSITRIVPDQSHTNELGILYADDMVADDGSRVFFETKAKLAPEAAAGKGNLYMWDRASGEVTLVGVLPGATPKAAPGGSFGGAYEWQLGKTASGGALVGQYVEAIHAISEAGDRAYFTAGETGQLYLRRNLNGPNPSTLQVSAPEAGATDPNGAKPAAFQEASPDGSHAFFLSSQKLTKDATTGPTDEGADLYRYDAATRSLVDIAPDGSGNGAEVVALLGAGADGSSGYLVAKAELVSGGVAGKNNIYRFEEEASGHFKLIFVATLGENDSENWTPTNYGARQAGEGFSGRSSRVTPDGEVLVFSSLSPITGFDNQGCAASGHEPCTEIFMYRAGAQQPVCVSCDPSGAIPAGSAELTAGYQNAHLIPAAGPVPRITRNVSEDGSRVFFETPDSLVAGDDNGAPDCSYLIHRTGLRARPTCMDVYEWEAVGAPGGSCTRAEANGGCLYLLSGGQKPGPSYFIDASADGQNVFIATAERLVPAADKDENFDVYDVRTGGGLASQQAMPGVPCTSGQACRGAAAPEGSSAAPGTAAFEGAGNPKPKRPQQGCKKKSKKCKKPKGRKKHKKHRKKSHGKPGHAGKKPHDGSKGGSK